MAAAVWQVAQKVEANVPRILVTDVPNDASVHPGSLTIRAARRPAYRKVHQYVAPATAHPLTQPHIPVEVAALAGTKWEDAPPSKVGPAHGYVMIDTGAAVSVVSRKWADTHGLTITPKTGVNIVGAGGTPV